MANRTRAKTATIQRHGMICSGATRRVYAADSGRERHRTRPAERAGELGEDRQVGMEPDALDATDAQRR